jgi:DNA-binding response OmpR family regulator
MVRHAKRSAGRGRILLAEDDHDLRRALEEVLTLAGYDVHAVATGTALLEELASCLVKHGKPADVMVTDIRMPGCNGLSIVDGLRAAGWTQPILVISAFGDAEVRARIKRLGVEFMPKPIDPDDLERTLSRMCAQAS